MRILVIDGQGGGLGRSLVAAIKAAGVKGEILAVGTNSLATAAMLKAGADAGATGENAVIVGCRRADVILGPLGVAIADALCGEVSPAMAAAVGQSEGQRVLIPVNHCGTFVAGLGELSRQELVQRAVERLLALQDGQERL